MSKKLDYPKSEESFYAALDMMREIDSDCATDNNLSVELEVKVNDKFIGKVPVIFEPDTVWGNCKIDIKAAVHLIGYQVHNSDFTQMVYNPVIQSLGFTTNGHKVEIFVSK